MHVRKSPLLSLTIICLLAWVLLMSPMKGGFKNNEVDGTVREVFSDTELLEVILAYKATAVWGAVATPVPNEYLQCTRSYQTVTSVLLAVR